ncbi:MAG: glycoside hydrolase family 43 protein [Bacteroidetes bacterium]|nr:glycoside hydrolase family 43 protein [Bacteroidota bacterium]
MVHLEISLNRVLTKYNRTLVFAQSLFLSGALLFILASCNPKHTSDDKGVAANPIFNGWYADPEGVVFDSTYWIFPTYSAAYEKQVFFDAFSSSDLMHWKKHDHVLDTSVIKWARQAMWAPAVVRKDDHYYLFFSANDVQQPGGPYWDEKNTINHHGGIGIAIADYPAGPYKDYLGKPLIAEFYNRAQPIDQFVFKDWDNQYYMFYGGWSHCNLGKLKVDFTGFIPWDDGALFREITPAGYVEGPFLFVRKGKYYFMWSEGGWTNDTYKVAYAIADKVTGPFEKVGTILQSNKDIATGAGHNSVINVPRTDEWYIVYHRRPIPNEGRDHRVTCIDKMEFDTDGKIKQVVMTK